MSIASFALAAPASGLVEFNVPALIGATGAMTILGGSAGFPTVALGNGTDSSKLTLSARTLVGLGSVTNSYTAGTVGKGAFRYQTGSSALVLNGGTVATNASAFTAAGSGTIALGADVIAPAGVYLNGYLRRVVLYPTAFANAQLQALTA